MITNDTLDDAYEQLKKIFINVSDQQLFILIVISMATDITGDQISGIRWTNNDLQLTLGKFVNIYFECFYSHVTY